MDKLERNQIGIYEKALPSFLTWEERLIAAKLAGYDFVEISIDESDMRLSRLDWTKEQKNKLVEAIQKTGVTISTMCLSGHRRFPLGSLNDEVREKALDIMRKAIHFAVDSGIRIIQLAGYDVYYEESNQKTIERFEEGLKKSIEWASNAGVILAMEVMDYEFMGSVKKIMKYVKEYKSPYFQIYPDLGNISAWGNDLAEDLTEGLGHIAAVHLKDTKPGEFRRVEFGTGCVDFVKGFKQLKAIGFHGPVLVEMWTDDSEDALQSIMTARKWIMGQMQKAEFNVTGGRQ